jgi:hypothetical protein
MGNSYFGEDGMIKPSHTQTPRTLQDCTFASWGDPIERPAPKSEIGMVAMAVVFVLGFAGIGYWGAVWLS